MLENVPSAIGQALSSIRPGLGKIIYARDDLAAPETIRVTSDAFATGLAIPARHTEDGAKVSPPLRFAGLPAGARSLALVVEDADSPTPAPLVHALVWDIPAEEDIGFQEAALDTGAMPTARAGASLGKNSFFGTGWLPTRPAARPRRAPLLLPALRPRRGACSGGRRRQRRFRRSAQGPRSRQGHARRDLRAPGLTPKSRWHFDCTRRVARARD